MTGQKDSVCVTSQIGLNPPPVLAGDKKGVNPNCCQMYTEIRYVKDVSCVGHLSSVNLVTNAPPVVMDPPVGARLHILLRYNSLPCGT